MPSLASSLMRVTIDLISRNPSPPPPRGIVSRSHNRTTAFRPRVFFMASKTSRSFTPGPAPRKREIGGCHTGRELPAAIERDYVEVASLERLRRLLPARLSEPGSTDKG